MRVIDSALSIAVPLGLDLWLWWQIDHDFGGRFDALWVRPAAIKKIIEVDVRSWSGRARRFLMNHSLPVRGWQYVHPVKLERGLARDDSSAILTMLSGRNTFLATCHRFFSSERPYQELQPVPAIMTSVERLTADFDDIVGVHIRRADNTKAIACSPTEEFAAVIANELALNPSTRFFIATDSPEEEEFLKRKFPGKTLSFPKSSLDRSRERAIQDAMIDLYCLSRCRKLIGSYWSSFSETAWQINGIEHVIIKR
jgi:hypothetical protein